MERLVRSIEQEQRLDPVADAIQQPIFRALMQVAPLRNLLNGTWMGHPVHSAVTDIPVGAWSAGMVLDLLDAFGVNRDLRPASDAVQAIGLAGALGAAVFGIADWSYTMDRPKRVGFVHGATNMVIAGMSAASLVARARGHRKTGVTLSCLGYDLLLLSSWLGGELAYRFGIGVDHTAFQEPPTTWTAVGPASSVSEGKLTRVDAGNVPVLLTRQQGTLHALGDVCNHLGCSLAEGSIEGNSVICPCHGSQFRLSDGKVLHGPATMPQPVYQARVTNDQVEIQVG